MLERYAALEGKIATVEAVRSVGIADVNAEADAELAPLMLELDSIREKLWPWWQKAGSALLSGARKSVELGGCMIGTRKGRDSLAVDGDENELVEKLRKRSWAEQLVRAKYSLNKSAILMSIDGCHAKQLKDLGFSRSKGSEQFFVERTEQEGTLAGAGK
jgi:phage host-nuclease inhibitor protein Gam